MMKNVREFFDFFKEVFHFQFTPPPCPPINWIRMIEIIIKNWIRVLISLIKLISLMGIIVLLIYAIFLVIRLF